MQEKKQSKSYLDKYFAVLNKFGVTPNFKFSDEEKEIIKYIDENTSVTFLTFYDKYDLKPSEAKEIIDGLIKKGAVCLQDDNIMLTNEAIKYIHTSKEQRKSEKKFRKFIDALTEKDLDEFMKLVESFVVKPTPIHKPRAKTTTPRKPSTRKATTKASSTAKRMVRRSTRRKPVTKDEAKPIVVEENK